MDAVSGAIEMLFESDNIKKRLVMMPISTSQAPIKLVASLHPPEIKSKVVSILDMRGGWKDNPDELIFVMRDAAVERRTIEQEDELLS